MRHEQMQSELKEYEDWLVHREYSPATIEKYTHVLSRFFQESRLEGEPTKEDVAAWRDGLARTGYSAASVNAMLAAVNGYQEFRERPQEKAKPLKRQRRAFRDEKRELNREEYIRLLNAARSGGSKRTLLLLQTICAMGIRVSELRAITVEAVCRGRARIQCKGKCREILLPAALCNRLKRWCGRQHIHSGPVFLSRRGNPLDRVTVWKLMKALCKAAGVAWEKVYPHNLRHLFARTFYRLERDLSKLADLLGHSSIETTRIYIMESGAEHQRLLERMHLLL